METAECCAPLVPAEGGPPNATRRGIELLQVGNKLLAPDQPTTRQAPRPTAASHPAGMRAGILGQPARRLAIREGRCEGRAHAVSNP